MTRPHPDPSGHRVIILAGAYAGHEGVCLGPSTEVAKWMVSPDNSDQVVPLLFDEEFGILVTEGN